MPRMKYAMVASVQSTAVQSAIGKRLRRVVKDGTKSLFPFLLMISVFLYTQGAASSLAQDSKSNSIDPKQMGFLAQSVELNGDLVHYYVSTNGKPLQRGDKKPMVLCLDGSGPSPLIWRQNGRVQSSIIFEATDFPNFHFVVLSKPGIKFFEWTKEVKSEKYDQTMSLRWRVDAAKAVLDQMVKDGDADSRQVIALGHSEGADVVPWVALESPHVTHAVALAPGGMSLMFDLIALTRNEIAIGKLSPEAGQQRILSMKSGFKKIMADPTSTTKKWSGEAYLRWSTFFRPALDAWRQLEKPVYLGICRDDQNTAPESGDAIELEFIRLRKRNYMATTWPCDHYFIDNVSEAGKSIDRRLEAVREILDWVKVTPAWEPKERSAPQMLSARDTFERLKTLVGKWEEVKTGSSKTLVEYSLLARESVLVEHWKMPSGSDAQTMYYMDGPNLVATHYCPKGSQPTLRLVNQRNDGAYEFQFDSGTNMDPSQPYQKSFQLQFKTDGTIWRRESYAKANKESSSELRYRRVK